MITQCPTCGGLCAEPGENFAGKPCECDEEIESRLNELYARHCKTCLSIQRPTAIYLGALEHEALKALGHRRVWFQITPPDKVCRMEWGGMKVYRVDSDSHIGFGSNVAL